MSGEVFPDCSPVFIVGAPRSGTTLLQLMLNAHPRVAILGEIHYFDSVLQLKHTIPSLSTGESIDKLVSLLADTRHMRYIGGAERLLAEVSRRLHDDETPTYAKLFRYLMQCHAASQGAARFGEKTPQNVRYLNDLLVLFPNARIIHIVRDPRDVVSSCLKVPWTANDVAVNSLKWRCDVSFARGANVTSECYIEVRYEDLVAGPADELRRICRFLGEEFHAGMLDYHRSAGRHVKDEPWKAGAAKPVYASSVGTWRRDLSASRAWIVEKVAGPFLSEFGYERASLGARPKLLAPLVLLGEFASYVKYRLGESRRRRREGADELPGESVRLRQMAWRILTGRATPSRGVPADSPSPKGPRGLPRPGERVTADE